jgi:4-hydroxybenzoate polyprenyltransferase/phosphoserine phosphatase
MTSSAVPLCVDLDGTLTRTDLLFESVARLLKTKPWLMLALPFWMLRGRAALKRRLAQNVSIDAASLPYHSELLAWLHRERATGREILLVTAADESLANQVASHIGLFDRVLASNGVINLKGEQKLNALRSQLPEGFEYAADSWDDLPVWRHCANAIVVGATPAILDEVRKHVQDMTALDTRNVSSRQLWLSLRPHQWLKNILIFVPLITSHQFLRPDLVLKAGVTFILFSLCASAQYILNDLVDVESDRRHSSKRHRPFASGDLPILSGLILSPVLLAVSIGIALFLSPMFAAALATYFLTSFLYSLDLKKRVPLDAFVLSGLYTFRIIVGHLVTAIPFSMWLLSFSFTLFLSLAFSKRSAELLRLPGAQHTASGRGYRSEDVFQVNLFGVCSAFLSAVIFLLYLQSDNVRALYRQPQFLWFLAPAYLYWVTHLWLRASRGEVNEDPVVFVLKDSVTHAVAAISGVIMTLATGFWQGTT